MTDHHLTSDPAASTAAGPPGTARRLLWRVVRRGRGPILVSVALLALWQLTEALVPVLIGAIIDRAIITSDGQAMLWWSGGLVVLFVILSYGYRFGSRFGIAAMQQETHLLRLEVAEHSLQPRGARTSSLTGETLSLATSDAESVGEVIPSLGYAIAAAASVILCAVTLLRTDLVVGLVVLVGVPVVLCLLQLVTPAISRRSRAQQESIALASGMATDFVRGLRVLKGIGAEDAAARRYRDRSQDAKAAGIRTASSYAAMQGLTLGLSGLFLALVALVAGQRALDGSITVGELVAVVGLTQFLAEPLRVLGHVSAQLAAAHGSAQRIVQFLHTPPLVQAGPQVVPDSAPSLQLDQVSTDSLHEVTLRPGPGELLGVVTDDAASAESLVRLLSAETSPRRGEVRLGGVPLGDLTVPARRRHLLVNPHHTTLFEGTLRDNVDLGSGLSGQRLDDVLTASATTDLLALHPDGVDQPVTSAGHTFSGGQQQRIALARAFAADPPILVLHEPTTAVDAVTEQRIADGLRRLRHAPGGTQTTWVITTSPALLAQADRVVVLRSGRLVATGTHYELHDHDDYQDLVLR